jgi:hypothetical protein
MTKLETILLIVQVIQFVAIYFITKMNRELLVEKNAMANLADEYQTQIQSLKKSLIDDQKKSKMSNDVLEILHDMKDKGAIFEVTRIDRNDIFFHNGSVYR